MIAKASHQSSIDLRARKSADPRQRRLPVARPTGAGARGGSIGLREAGIAVVIQRIQAGLPVQLLDAFQRSTDLPIETIAEAVRIPPRTLTRRRATGKLRPDESERLLRVSAVFDKAVDLFEGDRASATRWLQSPQPGLGGQRPLEYAKTEIGARAIEDLIGRLEHGVFT